MKFTLSWLAEYIQTNESIQTICDKLTDIGLEIEEIEDSSKSLAPFFVAQIVEASPHPNAEKLQICQVNIGEKENIQIVCGAANARTGLKVAYAPIGSVIPANDMKIKKSKIRDIESFGMLCSAKELLIGKDSEGIIEIDKEVEVGTKISDLYGSDVVIDINITPNRGDCLGVYGVARDLVAAGMGTLKEPEIKEVKGNFDSPIKVVIESESCPYFSGYYIKGLKNCDSPQWLKEKLELIGVNSISAIVDITNYVMYCLNQPLHSYDADKINGDIVVKHSKGEEFLSLKDLPYKLEDGELLVADQKIALSLAGIIGGKSSSCELETQNIFLEAAYFESEIVAKTGRKLNILSDSRYRFERGIDIANVRRGLDMAVNLILEICGGQVSKIVEAGSFNVELRKITFDLNKIPQILGINIDKKVILEILTNLGFSLKSGDKEDIYEVSVPSHRSDVAISEDLIEEIIRIYGYDKIKSEPLPVVHNLSSLKSSSTENARDLLCNSGMNEIISWSFISSKIAPIFADQNPELFLANPISVDMDYMRPSLIPGLVNAARKNQLRGFSNLSLFEIGKVFSGIDPNQQKDVISGLRIGKNQERNHYKSERLFDVIDVKKDLLDCLETFGFNAKSLQMSFDEAPKYYHPYRFSSVKLGKKIIGYFGELNPIVNKKLDISGRINIFEVFIDELPPINNKKSVSKKPFNVSDLQMVNRDFAFIVDEKVSVGDIIKAVEKSDRELIKKVIIFDIYQGDKIEKNQKSIAFTVEIQPIIKTLTSEEIEQISDKIIKSITNGFGGVLRDG